MEHLTNLANLIVHAESELDSRPESRKALDNVIRLTSDLPTKKQGTARSWFEGRTMTEVETVQVRRNGSPWIPGPRMVEARATMVRLDGSVRDFKGLRVIGADDSTLVVHDSSGFDTIIIYRAVPRD